MMNARDGFEHGVPCWVARVGPGAEAARGFYAELLGWDSIEAMPGQYLCRLRDRSVAAIVEEPSVPPGWQTYVWVDDAPAAVRSAEAAGASVVREPFELGTWAMSALSADDTAAAELFHGELFGWTTERFDAGGQSVTMFRLPGFVGGEPEQPVSREVVAVMTPAGPGERAAWSADFWVADLDATAAAAERLGGSVLSPPVAAPPGRNALLADPGGAAFSASQVLPK